MREIDGMEKPLTQKIKPNREPLSLKESLSQGGYQGLKLALEQLAPREVTERVKNSGLKGRGGGGFPTGVKWSFVPMDEKAYSLKYMIANADEMEPGTFKDRLLLEGDPFLLIEGMTIAAYAVQASKGYVFLRSEYKAAELILKRAIAEAYEAHYLGENIFGSSFSFDLYLHMSAGRYICGEETALLNALEGKRAVPRPKPPYPAVAGLWGKPTVVNNVETFCNVPGIIQHGVDWYLKLSQTAEGGTKIYGVSGKVQKPGAWELPMGTSVREILEEYAGGMKSGLHFRGLIPGGASTGFLLPEHLDVKMDFSSVQKVGSRLGTGTMIVLDDKTCPVGLVHNLQVFFARESCGWCTPCREGLPWVVRVLAALENGEGRWEDLEVLEHHTRFLGLGYTFCALAPGAMEPLQSALEYYREDFEQHIHQKKCPWKD